ncbi:cupin domain-containing protein [Promicromonospora soli]
MTDASSAPVFPGGTSVSHLRVYDWPAPDAPGGSGSPHFHTASTEAYVTLAGRGRVQTLSQEGFAEHELVPGRIVWFSPGVIHRSVNDGGLEVLVVMSNAGLPEAGDAVLTFPPEILVDPAAYRDAATLPSPSAGGAASDGGGWSSADAADPAEDDLAVDPAEDDPVVAAAALARRDLALEGFQVLRDAVEEDGEAAFDGLYVAAAQLVAPQAAGWRDVWTTSVGRAVAETDWALAALAPESGADPGAAEAAVVGHLEFGRVAARDAEPGPRRYGMCGRLQVWSTRA